MQIHYFNMTVAQVPSPYYQHVIARGLPYERGLAHGQQAAQKVRDNVAYYKTPGKLAKLWVGPREPHHIC